MCAASDSHFDATNANGGGGLWLFWNTLIGEGLIEYGRADLAADLLRRILATQVTVLKQQKSLYEFYNSDEARGLGDISHLGGIVPLHLLMRVWGVRVISSTKVWTGGAFTWDTPVTIRQHGVTIQRTREQTRVQFPSGHTTTLENGEWREVSDERLPQHE